ncbi:MAG TPA: ZIP family metal transporter [Candidatus Limnocylindria bacterium]|nr:ZIP family metal transporter [Candidatus Limnocylindria bacterium]
MPPWLQAVLATLVVSATALVGIVFVFTRRLSQRGELVLLSFAAGVLLATSFLELLPEATTLARAPGNIFTATLGAMIGFFLLERVLHGFHVHEENARERHVIASPHLILIGDALHNFIDGLAIAASFAVGPEVGIVTTVAVTVHEVPQELADFGILVAGGMTPRIALLANFLCGLTAVVGALVFFAAGATVEPYLAWFMAATAGMFLYVASADLIPQVHHHRSLHSRAQLPFLGGVLLIALLHRLGG